MIIGVDGNEANVRNRVGSGEYAFELLHQFAKLASTRHSGDPAQPGTPESNRVTDFGQARMTSFLIFLKEPPLSDLPKQSENFKYKIFGPKRLWTQFALPLNLTFGQKPDVFFSMAHYGPRFS